MSRLPYRYPDPSTGEFDPFALMRNLEWLAERILPTGTMILVPTGTTCPEGFTKLATSNGAYLRISTGTAGGTGGNLTVADVDPGHLHTAGTYAVGSHLHATGTLNMTADAAHTHPVNPPSKQTSTTSDTGTRGVGAVPTVEASHTHTVDIEEFTSGVGSAHGHTMSGNTASTTPTFAGSSASGTTGVTGTIAPTYLDMLLCTKD